MRWLWIQAKQEVGKKGEPKKVIKLLFRENWDVILSDKRAIVKINLFANSIPSIWLPSFLISLICGYITYLFVVFPLSFFIFSLFFFIYFLFIFSLFISFYFSLLVFSLFFILAFLSISSLINEKFFGRRNSLISAMKNGKQLKI